MELVHGFNIDALKHSFTGHVAFPKGVWYGVIDGYEIGAPYSNAESARYNAKDSLLNGRYEVALTSALECYQGWLKQGVTGNLHEKAVREIENLQTRLNKLQQAGLGQEEKNESAPTPP